MSIWQENGVGPAKQSPAAGIELEWAEGVEVVGDSAHAVRKLSPQRASATTADDAPTLTPLIIS